MVKRSCMLFALFLFVFLTSGCTLIKGTAGLVQGVKAGAAGAKEGAKEGFKEDAKAVTKAVNTADAWVKENLW